MSLTKEGHDAPGKVQHKANIAKNIIGKNVEGYWPITRPYPN